MASLPLVYHHCYLYIPRNYFLRRIIVSPEINFVFVDGAEEKCECVVELQNMLECSSKILKLVSRIYSI